VGSVSEVPSGAGGERPPFFPRSPLLSKWEGCRGGRRSATVVRGAGRGALALTALGPPAEAEGAADQGPVPADGAIGLDLKVRPAQLLFHLLIPLLNGLITNDKFCLSRHVSLKLTWSRYPLRLRLCTRASGTCLPGESAHVSTHRGEGYDPHSAPRFSAFWKYRSQSQILTPSGFVAAERAYSENNGTLILRRQLHRFYEVHAKVDSHCSNLSLSHLGAAK
jgi:hypothetical protein